MVFTSNARNLPIHAFFPSRFFMIDETAQFFRERRKASEAI
jgi:hypothetical protein